MMGMIFNNDRMQYSEAKDMYYLYEFIKVGNIQALNELMDDHSLFMEELKKQGTVFDQRKIDFISSIKEDMFKIFIVHQEEKDMYLVWITCQKSGRKKTKSVTYRFKQLQTFFQNLNNIDGKTIMGSKKLGDAKKGKDQDQNEDLFTNKILGTLHGMSNFHDDNGITLTKQLLDDSKTKGFDFDLYQYIPSTNEFVLYEFLKRNNQYVNNITAHPTRYTWMGDKAKKQNQNRGEYVDDNKRKFISLWNAKEHFNARFYLVSYSEDESEEISIMEMIHIDEKKGIQEEKKYCMSQEEFIDWLGKMNSYTDKNNDYLRDYDMVHYGPNFFEEFRNRGKAYYEYGNPFLQNKTKRSV